MPSEGPESWRRLLADPAKQWKPGRSAYELANSWERAQSSKRGLPREVAAVLDTESRTREAALLLGIPEYRTALEGGSRASQTDLWALLQVRDQLVSLAVEGKAGEAFGPTIEAWRQEASEGKERRLESLCGLLGLQVTPPGTLRYQLLHRAVSAVIAAHLFHAASAVLLVHSFDEDRAGWTDFEAFGKLLGTRTKKGGLALTSCPGTPLLLAWVEGVPTSELPAPAGV